jgi:hypothetical protein
MTGRSRLPTDEKQRIPTIKSNLDQQLQDHKCSIMHASKGTPFGALLYYSSLRATPMIGGRHRGLDTSLNRYKTKFWLYRTYEYGQAYFHD